MSFINSVLAGITGGNEASPTSTVRSTASASRPLTQTASVSNSPGISTTVRSTASASRPLTQTAPISNDSRIFKPQVDAKFVPGQKRKAEQEIERIAHKSPKKETPSPSAVQRSRPLTETALVPVRHNNAKDNTKPIASPSPVTAPKAQPRKGTFAETLARARAAQTLPAQVGAIKHKPKEYLSKKERLALQEKAKVSAKVQKDSRNGDARKDPKFKGTSRAVDLNQDSSSPGNKGNARAKADRVGYKGTSQAIKAESDYKGTSRARSQELSYKGTSVLKASRLARKESFRDESRDRSRSSSQHSPARYRYASYSDEEDDVADHDSEGSSDMEAAPHELEDEEFMSLKTARKEDEEALREEMALKREKELKRKRLQAMAVKKR
ncbi:MAG: hypothetical protein M1837_003075 [Sclerophora amabilis]|nr:MAG: hypothetical protein M1837_003075 [Sclerophora amabilis]